MLVAFLAAVFLLNLSLAMGMRAASRGHTAVGLAGIVTAIIGLVFASWLTSYTIGAFVLLGTVATTLVAVLAWRPWRPRQRVGTNGHLPACNTRYCQLITVPA